MTKNSIYAIEKNSTVEMQNLSYKSKEELDTAVSEYEKLGFKVYVR